MIHRLPFYSSSELFWGPCFGASRPHELFPSERRNPALGVLSQFLGTKAVAFFLKQLNNVSQGWLSLRAVAAVLLSVQEARELTLGQNTVIYIPHMVQLVHQVVLLELDFLTLKTTSLVYPAVFLSAQQIEGAPGHDCLQTTEVVYSSRPDIGDSPLERPNWELFSNGSSFV